MPKIIVAHRYYGCDSGCCGHIVEVDGQQVGDFYFDHPYTDSIPSDEEYNANIKAFVKELVTEACGEEHVKDIDWDNCLVIDE